MKHFRIPLLLLLSLILFLTAGCGGGQDAPKSGKALESEVRANFPDTDPKLLERLLAFRPQGGAYSETTRDGEPYKTGFSAVDRVRDYSIGEKGDGIWYLFHGNQRTIINTNDGTYYSDTVDRIPLTNQSPYYSDLTDAPFPTIEEKDGQIILRTEKVEQILDENLNLVKKIVHENGSTYETTITKRIDDAKAFYDKMIDSTKELERLDTLSDVTHKTNP